MVPDHADPARRLTVEEAQLLDFRSYARLELGLEPGLVLVTGPNGVGKTNLLEGLHVASQGFSFRTRADAQLVRHGADVARAAVTGRLGTVAVSTDVRVGTRDPKRIRLNGAPVATGDELRGRIRTLAFTPDRLVVVKGGPAARRAYFDRALGRLLPARATLPLEYGSALGQRNAGLRQLAAGLTTPDALAPWTERVATAGAALVDARRATIGALEEPFAERTDELGLPDARLEYAGEPPTVGSLEARLARDVERGATGLGPHLDDVRVLAGDRDLRTYGSQGEQRLAVLALLLAEAALLAERSGIPPLLLLDDALSELDADRRRTLSDRLGRLGQTVVTATGAEALPLAPAQLLIVSPGRVEAA